MRNRLLFLLISFFVSVPSFGQFSFGVKAGLNINDIDVRNSTSSYHEDYYSINAGYHVGVYGVLKLTDRISLIPEIQFSQKGYNSPTNKYEARTNLNYIESPLLLNYSIINYLSIDLGASFSYKISTIAKGGGHKHNIDNTYDNNFDFGVNGGLRFKASKRISLIGRYYYGLLPILEISYRTVTNIPEKTIKMFNTTIQLTLNYQIK